MSLHPEVIQLLSRWERLRKDGTILTPEELCENHPEHLSEVARHLNAVSTSQRVPKSKVTSSSAYHQVLRTGNIPVLEGYELLEELGKGGMGIVYKAKQEWPQRIVALKMLRNQSLTNEEDLERFEREINALCQLDHPNIVRLFDAGHFQNYPYFTMEYVDGSNLAEMYRGKGCSIKEAVKIMRTLAEAIQDAHDQGILHRDLKPANVLLKKNGMPKITDFGLAKRLDYDSGQTPSYMVLGTPSYMAPEQAGSKNDDVCYATDVYGLGAIFYELLTGKPPFRGDAPHDTLIQVLTQKVIPPSKHKKVPKELEEICLKCLEKKPHQRYATARELADALARWREKGRKGRAKSFSWQMIVLTLCGLLLIAAVVYRLFM